MNLKSVTICNSFGVFTTLHAQKKRPWRRGWAMPKIQNCSSFMPMILGVTNSENRASIYGLYETPVNSASIMVPCPWFPEIADYPRKNPEADPVCISL